MPSAALTAAAATVAEARLAVERTRDAIEFAIGERDTVKRRIDEKNAERASISAERKAGVDKKSHGARLAVLDMDLGHLGEMLSDAEGAVTRATAEDTAAKARLAEAEALLARETDGELLAGLVEHAGKLGERLSATIGEIDAAWRRLGRDVTRAPWVPSEGLADAIKRRDLTRAYRGAA